MRPEFILRSEREQERPDIRIPTGISHCLKRDPPHRIPDQKSPHEVADQDRDKWVLLNDRQNAHGEFLRQKEVKLQTYYNIFCFCKLLMGLKKHHHWCFFSYSLDEPSLLRQGVIHTPFRRYRDQVHRHPYSFRVPCSDCRHPSPRSES